MKKDNLYHHYRQFNGTKIKQDTETQFDTFY